MRKAVAWGAGIGTLVVIDAALDRRHDGSTLSECTRMIYRTDTALGRYAFLASWVGFATWFPVHILRRR
ncbi:MAG: hypothetical protein J7518_17910 [Nocardioidaceae bacterium]|nr:hypothetical protein [Nocardioidaceae bacterium]